MGGDPSARKRRPVLIHTLRGSVEGSLHVNPGVRTLDFLNVPHRFVAVDATEIAVADWSFEQGRLAINKDLIVFVTELTDEAPATDRRAEAAHFTREGISLRVADCDVKGYMQEELYYLLPNGKKLAKPQSEEDVAVTDTIRFIISCYHMITQGAYGGNKWGWR